MVCWLEKFTNNMFAYTFSQMHYTYTVTDQADLFDQTRWIKPDLKAVPNSQVHK